MKYKHTLDATIDLDDLDADKILAWVKESFLPEEVFDDGELKEWAEENNYVKA